MKKKIRPSEVVVRYLKVGLGRHFDIEWINLKAALTAVSDLCVLL